MSSDALIDVEFRSIIPPLAPEEFKALEESIIAEGCRDAIVVWKEKGVILDGHNRYDICVKHSIPYRTFEKPLADRDEAILWIIDNQLGRRNLNPEQMSLLRGQKYNKIKAREQSPSGQFVRKAETAETLASKHGVDERTIRRDGQFAQAVDTLENFLPGITARVIHGESISRQAVIEAAKEPETAAEKLAKPHVAHNAGDNEWYTPSEYIDAARLVMGGIDVDPASTELANSVVKAQRYFSAEDNGLLQKWEGRVWLNPPYAQPLIQQFCDKLISERQNISQAIALVNNATETQWFQSLASVASAICFPRGRVRFWAPDKISQPLQGQAIIYIGTSVDKFREAFSRFGVIKV